MTSLWQNEGTTIGRVTIRSRVEDPLAAQQRVASLLKNAEMRQSRLSPSAILFVRKLQDPPPNTRWLNTSRLHLPAAWEHAVTQQLDRLSAGAVRPVFDAVPPSADAVVFQDRAELLACLTQDWLTGALRSNWWWQTFLRSGDLHLVVMREWERSPELLPAAIEFLHRSARAVEFVRRLPDSCTTKLVSGMLRAHGLADPRTPSPRATPTPAVKTPAPGKAILATPPASPPNKDPWLPWVPEASAGELTTNARLLLAYASLLRRVPNVVRAPAFTASVAEWYERAGTNVNLPGKPRPGSKAPAPIAFETQLDERAPISKPGGIEPSVQGDVPAAQTASPAAGNSIAADTAPPGEPAASEPQAMSKCTDAAAADLLILTAAPAESLSTPAVETGTFASGVPKSPATGASPDNPTELETDFGGVFFLLNLALYLNLYGDFTQPCHKGLQLNIWDFVALFGTELAGQAFTEDSAWARLADLAGRGTGQNPGEAFHPPDDWRVPTEWLQAFPEPQPWQAAVRDERLCLTHPAGFCAVDVPLAGRARSRAIEEESQPYAATVSNLQLGDTTPAGTPLTRWTAWMTGYLRARLIRAFGRANAVELLCRIPARLRVTPAHLQVWIQLDRHPIEIRLAALDRDPGWIPAAGRYVTFHFN